MHLMIAWADAVLRLEKIEKNGSVSKVIPPGSWKSKLLEESIYAEPLFMSNPPKQQAFYFENAYEF